MESNKAMEEFGYCLRAGYPYFYVSTYEMDRCIDLLTGVVDDTKGYEAKVWDCQGGTDGITPDPLDVLDALDKEEPGTVYFLKNYNWFMMGDFDRPNAQIITTIQRNYTLYTRREKRKVVVIVTDAPMDDEKLGMPTCVSRNFLPITFELPTEDEIEVVLDEIIGVAKKNKKFKKPDKDKKARILDASLGLGLQEVENAYAYTLVKSGDLVPEDIDRLKAVSVEKASGVYFTSYGVTFDQLKGLDNIKNFSLSTIRHPNAKGILLLGPAGTGKSTFCQGLANETGMRMLTVEMAEFQGGIVGQTEQRFREAIAVIKAMAGSQGVICFVDECSTCPH